LAEYGHTLQIVDDSSGDRGNDGYDADRRLLLAIYCPEKDLSEANVLRKGRRDLAKAVALRNTPGYAFDAWVFVTPVPLPEKVQATLRAEAEADGLKAQFLSGVHLEDIYLRHIDLRPVFPELDYPRVDQELGAINKKLDTLIAGSGLSPVPQPTPSEADPTSSALDPKTATQQESFWPALSISVGSPRLFELQQRLHGGDLEALFELERFRLEAASPSDAAAALMIQLGYETERLNFDKARLLATQGRQLAERAGLVAEQAVFLAREGHAATMLLVVREMEFNSRLAFSLVAGFPLLSVAEAQKFDSEVPPERVKLDEQFAEAYRLAREGRNLEGMFQVAIYRAMAATHSSYPQRLLLEAAQRGEARARIGYYQQQMEGSYSLAISIGSALESPRHLALAYSNLASDLVAFGALDRAQSHAEHAHRLASEIQDADQIERTGRILEAIKRRRSEPA
jgi:hypothetical protein